MAFSNFSFVGKKNIYFIIHKPYKILSQFTDEGVNRGLNAVFKIPKNVYPVGRLDLDSEGLLILTNDKSLTNRLLDPKNNHRRVYWVEVEGELSKETLLELEGGVEININGKKHKTKKTRVRIIQPKLEERDPPVNYKKHPIRTWIEIELTEGKNRQVRRMTAKVGHPTLRLVRIGIEQLRLEPLRSGEITQISEKVLLKKLNLL